MSLTFGSLFAGIGGFDLGFERAGMVCKWQVEIDDYCQRVLAKHWPEVKRYGDIRETGKHNLAAVDVICGGFSCLPSSIAGKRKGKNDERNTWPAFNRIICELEPRWVVAENVPGILSVEGGSYFGGILRDLSENGYHAQWGTIYTRMFGIRQDRERLFIVAARTMLPVLDWGIKAIASRRRLPDRFEASNYFAWFTAVKCLSERNDSGLPRRVDRLRSLGNAVTPQVAEFIGRQIVDIDGGLDV